MLVYFHKHHRNKLVNSVRAYAPALLSSEFNLNTLLSDGGILFPGLHAGSKPNSIVEEFFLDFQVCLPKFSLRPCVIHVY